MVLKYIRNKHASACDLDEETVMARTCIEDTFFAATVEMTVQLPDLEITAISGEIRRAFHEECQGAIPLLQEAVGLLIGPGILKSVNSLVGGATGCPKMADLALECCNQIILSFTAKPLKTMGPMTQEALDNALLEQLRQNPRMIGSCIAFAEDSPFRKAFER